MVNMENPGIQALDVWRKLADFTPALVNNPDNGNIWVSMHNITGRGTWISYGYSLTMGGAHVEVQIRYNIDGAGPVTVVLTSAGVNQGWGMGVPVFFGFETSLIVEMRLSGGGTTDFTSVAVVE